MKGAANILEFKGKKIDNEEGFLINPEDWSEEIGRSLCARDGLLLTNSHWQVILFIRTYYEQYKAEPMTRIIVRELNKRNGEGSYSIKRLYKLFPNTPINLLCKYAGIPKPAKCT